MICFFLGDQELAAPIEHVKETIVLRPITRVFLVPAWLAGIINLRGDVVAVIDLAALLGLTPMVIGPSSRILIARVTGPSGTRTAGLLVDRLAEVRHLDPASLVPPPSTVTGETASLLTGVTTLPGGRPLLCLDMVQLFESERMKAFARRPIRAIEKGA